MVSLALLYYNVLRYDYSFVTITVTVTLPYECGYFNLCYGFVTTTLTLKIMLSVVLRLRWRLLV